MQGGPTVQYGMKLPQTLSRILPGEFDLTPPVISLLSANLITIVLAIAGNWDAGEVIFIYWVQSVIIGIFTVIMILGADTTAISAAMNRSYAKKGETGMVDPGRVRTQAWILATIFAIHYGIFHIAYYFFFVESQLFGVLDLSSPGIWISCGLFFVNHLFSFLYYRDRLRQDEEFMTDTFTHPYYRIIPMHFTILFGAIVTLVLGIAGITSTLPVLVVFLLFKTAADLAMHLHKHAGWQGTG
jgi:hypothetical protein